MTVPNGTVRRPMTGLERLAAMPQVPWSDLALAPLNGLLAAVPVVVLVGLPLYLVLWLTELDDPVRWVGLLLVGTFAVVSATALSTGILAFVRARTRIDDDLLDDVVEDRVVHVTAATEVVTDPPSMYLRFDDGETIVLKGDYIARLRRTATFPSTTLRLIQLPKSRAVLGVLPLGDAFPPAFIAAQDRPAVELDGEPMTPRAAGQSVFM